MRWLAPALLVLTAAPRAAAQSAPPDDAPVRGEVAAPDGALVLARPLGSARDVRLDAARRSAEEASALQARSLQQYAVALDARHAGDAAADAGARREAERLRAGAGERWARAVAELDRIEPSGLLRVRVEALALRAFVLEQLDRDGDALAAARALVALCPSCVEAGDAYVRIGERAFADAELMAAIDAYTRAIAVPGISTQLRAYAHYKLGWARLNLAEFEAAWAALDRARRDAASDGARGRILAREAARDQVRVLAYLSVDGPEAAARVRALATDQAERERLAERYAEQLREDGRAADADAFERSWAPPPR